MHQLPSISTACCPLMIKSSSYSGLPWNISIKGWREDAESLATLSYVEAYASSTCEMVSEMLQYIGDNIKIKSIEADCMYSGIMIDTNNFMTKTGVNDGRTPQLICTAAAAPGSQLYLVY